MKSHVDVTAMASYTLYADPHTTDCPLWLLRAWVCVGIGVSFTSAAFLAASIVAKVPQVSLQCFFCPAMLFVKGLRDWHKNRSPKQVCTYITVLMTQFAHAEQEFPEDNPKDLRCGEQDPESLTLTTSSPSTRADSGVCLASSSSTNASEISDVSMATAPSAVHHYLDRRARSYTLKPFDGYCIPTRN